MLWQVLQEKAPDGGLWNGRKSDWLTSLTGRQISRQRGGEILRQMTFRRFLSGWILHPERNRVKSAFWPAHTSSRWIRTTCLEKKLAIEVRTLQTTYPEAEIQLWWVWRISVGAQTNCLGGFMYQKAKPPLPINIGDTYGCGCMPLSILKAEKLRRGFYPM